jgi:anti-sigma regulatory factor (Ser/Thr protein kinase)
MADVGANPGRIIPAWDQFVATHKGEGRRLRGVGEPIFPERSSDELVECEGHEALLNASFPQNLPFWLVCPYDKTALPPAVLVEAERNHPLLREGKREKPSEIYRGERVQTDPFTAPLPDAPVDALVVAYDATTLGKARALVSRRAAVAGFRPSALADLVFAVNEVATNSIRHGGGAGTLRLWLDDDRLLCELRDSGHFQHQPLVGRERPTADPSGPRGLWLANQLCDLVQVRSFPTGAVVRLHMRRR